MKLTNHTCACNGLTNFEFEAQATGNGSYAETYMEKLVKSPPAILCFGGFSTFGTTVRWPLRWPPVPNAMQCTETPNDHLIP